MRVSIFACFAIFLVVTATASSFSQFKSKIIPSTAVNGTVQANFLSSYIGLDGPQLSGINSTSWDWWYFDAISEDLKTSFCVVFYTALASGFPFLHATDRVTVIGIYSSFANGTLDSRYLNASEAIVTTVDEGSQGEFKGSGASWNGTPDLSQYIVKIDSPANGIVGTFKLKSNAPAHYPCGPAQAGQNMKVGPNIGWSNALPDAIASVDFDIDGSHLAFQGVGYHDKNWSDQPFVDNVASWYWGHGRLGEYSIVWFDFLGLDGKNYVSAYAAKQGKIVTACCQAGSVKVRPSGVNNEYPPKIGSGNPGGFTVDLKLDNGEYLNVNVTNEQIILAGAPFYARWAGSLAGSVNGDPAIRGVAVLEEFKMTS